MDLLNRAALVRRLGMPVPLGYPRLIQFLMAPLLACLLLPGYTPRVEARMMERCGTPTVMGERQGGRICWFVDDGSSGNNSYTHHDTGDHTGGGPNPGQTDNDLNAASKDCSNTGAPPSVAEMAAAPKGNPILISTGNKIEPEVDFSSNGEMPLYLTRTYNHYWNGVGLFGKYWLSNLDYKITFGSSAVNSCYPRPGGNGCVIGTNTIIWALRPDGRRIKYIKKPDGIFYEEKASPISKIVRQSNGSFVLYGEDNTIEVYSATGFISQLKNEQGIGWTFAYNGSYLTKVTHTSGRFISLVWTSGRLTSVRDPAGSYYGYSYFLNKFGAGIHLLAASSRPGDDETTFAYHYEDSRFPGALTGKSINGVRYSKFTYDGNGYAASTEHNGAEKYSFVYTPGANGYLTVLETNPLGKKTTYVFKDGKTTSVVGQASTHCVASNASTQYDSNGYPSVEVGFNGSTTKRVYNAKGQVTNIIEAFGELEARETRYTWDAARNRVSAIELVGQLKTTYTFTSDNRIATEKTTNLSAAGVSGQTRTTTYAYTKYANGMLAKVVEDGPVSGASDAVTTTFDSLGNLTSVTNGLGHKTVYSNHNALGEPGRITNPNGGVTDYGYDAQGRIVSELDHVGSQNMLTTWKYDGRGLLVSTTHPDNHTVFYHYDIQRRVVAEFEAEKGGTYAYRSYKYNLASDVTQIDTWRLSGAPADPYPYASVTGGAAQFLIQSVPATLNPGQTSQAVIRMLNTGTTAWTSGANFKLGAQNPRDTTRWGSHRVELPDGIAPGEVAVFAFPIKAPTTAGNYNFQWRMVQDGVAWFGDLTPNLVIKVGSPPTNPPPGGGGGGNCDPVTHICTQPQSTTPPMEGGDGVDVPADPALMADLSTSSEVDVSIAFEANLIASTGSEDIGPTASITTEFSMERPFPDEGAEIEPTAFVEDSDVSNEPAPFDLPTGTDAGTASIVAGATGTLYRRQYIDYDELSRVRGRRGSNGQSVTYQRDAGGNVNKVIDSVGEPTTITYDGLSRASKVVDARGGITTFVYDAADRVTKVVAFGRTTTYIFDGFGQLLKLASPDAGTTTNTFDNAGQLTVSEKSDGYITNYTHDGLGRIRTRSAGGETHTFTYDSCVGGKGFICAITDPSGSLSYTYSALGWLASQRQSIGSFTHDQAFARDGMGRVTGISYTGNVSVGYAYAYGRLQTVTAKINGSTKTVASGLAYQPFGDIASFTYGNGLARTVNHDLDARVTGISTMNAASVLQSLTLGLNSQDEIIKITNGASSSLTQSFGYDELSRLVSVVASGANQTISYDGAGNRTSHVWGGATDTYNISSGSNRLSNIDGPRAKTYLYDFNGNIRSNGVSSFSYDAFNRLFSTTRNGIRTSYWVNAVGQRVYKTQGAPVATQFVYGPGGELSMELTAGSRSHYIRAAGELVGLVRDGQLFFIHTDQVGRPEILTNSARSIVWRAKNYAFDREVILDSIGGLNIGFPGQYYDSESGLWNNGFRDYDPSVGRYIQSDPIGLLGGTNTYTYVESNPLFYSDALGLSKGGKRNLSVGGYNKRSDPREVERALREARENNASREHINALRALLKVIKRGGTMSNGLLPGMMFERLMEQECGQGNSDACAAYCRLNPDECEAITEDWYKDMEANNECPAIRGEALIPVPF